MRKHWSSLDNAAKIFPPAESKANTQVFRFACELYEEIDCDILQNALDETIKTFDVYQCILRRGMFWYYLEECAIRPIVHEEYKNPCAKMYDANDKGLLYEVTYYHRRINLELYHVLSDGTGAIQFLKAIVANYLSEAHGISVPFLGYNASQTQMGDDSFKKYSTDKDKSKKKKYLKACKINGAKFTENRVKIITGTVSVQAVLDAAHKYNTTMTSFLCSCFMRAIAAELPLRSKNRPIVMAVPVNLRRFFPSQSARNFFSIIHVAYDFKNNQDSLPDIISSVDKSFKDMLTIENLSDSINSYSSLERNIFARIAPLFFKYIVLKIAYRITQKRATATISNVGTFKVPDEISQYIHTVDVFNSTGKLQGCVISYGDRLSISFTSQFLSAEIERRFFAELTSLGINVEITANKVDEK